MWHLFFEALASFDLNDLLTLGPSIPKDQQTRYHNMLQFCIISLRKNRCIRHIALSLGEVIVLLNLKEY